MFYIASLTKKEKHPFKEIKHILHKCLLPVSAFHVSYQIPKQHTACNIMSHHHQSREDTFVNQDNQLHETLWPLAQSASFLSAQTHNNLHATDCWPFEI